MSGADPTPRPVRFSRWKWFVISALCVLFLAEAVTRIVTYVAWQLPLLRHPDVARRISGYGKNAPRWTVGQVIRPAGQLVAPVLDPLHPEDRVPEWSTFEEFPASGFRTPLATSPRPGTVRIVCVGGSTTFNGYPEELQILMDAEFGADRVDVVNMGVPASNSETALVLMRRHLTKWSPDIVVAYFGFNDLVFYTIRYLALFSVLEADLDLDAPPLTLPPRSMGIADLLFDRTPVVDVHPLFRLSRFLYPVQNYWQMTRMAWQSGFDLYLSTFAGPDYESMPEDERDEFDTAIRYLWPPLVDTDQYAGALDEYNRRLRRMASVSGTPVIDVSAAIQGGRDLFQDNCHRTPAGITLHAEAVFGELRPRVAGLLERGARSASVPTLSEYRPLPIPRGGLANAHPKEGNCNRGPCPEGTCFVPAGMATYGYPSSLQPRLAQHQAALTGLGDPAWFKDDVPQRMIGYSAFCIDETEAPESSRQSCIASGRCPPYEYGDRAPGVDPVRLAAVMPTFLDASFFCNWRGGRLPTDLEWEAAARGNDGRLLPWGDTWTGLEANFRGSERSDGIPTDPNDGYARTAPLETFSGASVFGPVDMAGNLWEWVADCFTDESHDTMIKSERDPWVSGPPDCQRFLRGGSYNSLAGILERRNARGSYDIDADSRGVRCVFDFGTRHVEVRQLQ